MVRLVAGEVVVAAAAAAVLVVVVVVVVVEVVGIVVVAIFGKAANLQLLGTCLNVESLLRRSETLTGHMELQLGSW